jgi:hypothetical protein
MTPTQEDREAAAAFFRDERTGLAVKFNLGHDPSPLLEAFMRHRLAAEERGARMALEAAAKKLEEQAARDVEASKNCRSGNAGRKLIAFAQRRRDDATAIRQIDPASLGAE